MYCCIPHRNSKAVMVLRCIHAFHISIATLLYIVCTTFQLILQNVFTLGRLQATRCRKKWLILHVAHSPSCTLPSLSKYRDSVACAATFVRSLFSGNTAQHSTPLPPQNAYSG